MSKDRTKAFEFRQKIGAKVRDFTVTLMREAEEEGLDIGEGSLSVAHALTEAALITCHSLARTVGKTDAEAEHMAAKTVVGAIPTIFRNVSVEQVSP